MIPTFQLGQFGRAMPQAALPLWNYVTWVGDGTGARTITTGIDMTAGGLVYYTASGSVAAADVGCAYSMDGTTVYVDPSWYSTGAQSTDATTIFGNGTIQVPTGKNKSLATYYALVLRKAPGFIDIVRYAGNATNRTIAHALGVVPGAIFLKRGGAVGIGYYSAFGNAQSTLFNSNSDPIADAVSWNSTTPTSSVFSVGNGNATNQSGQNFIAVLFAGSGSAIECGSYTGNNSATGPTVTVGFEPGVIITKRNAPTMHLQLRSPGFSGNDERWRMSTTGGYQTAANTMSLDGTTGFIPLSTNTDVNAAATYAYIALRKPA